MDKVDRSCPYCGAADTDTDFSIVHSLDGAITLGYDESWCYSCGGEWYQDSVSGTGLFLLSDDKPICAPLTKRVKEAVRKRNLDNAWKNFGNAESAAE